MMHESNTPELRHQPTGAKKNGKSTRAADATPATTAGAEKAAPAGAEKAAPAGAEKAAPAGAEKAAPAGAEQAAPPPAEWELTEPTEKGMGLIRLTLDKGVKTTAIGQLYGLDFEIEGTGFSVRVFFDYYNRRLKVLDYQATDYRALAERLSWLAEANGYDKIFVKARRSDWQKFLCLGFMLEGILKYYYRGEDAYVLSRFSSLERITSEYLIEESALIETLTRRPAAYTPAPLPDTYTIVRCDESHIPQLVTLYRRVFRTYPSPLTHPDYIQQTMRRSIIYRAVIDDRGQVISAASADVDEKHSNAELTDCATSARARGRGLMIHLLGRLEDDLRRQGIQTGYSLARARSQGMNRVFYRLGYEYSGRLINNCDIYGRFEDMNIWVKQLAPGG